MNRHVLLRVLLFEHILLAQVGHDLMLGRYNTGIQDFRDFAENLIPYGCMRLEKVGGVCAS